MPFRSCMVNQPISHKLFVSYFSGFIIALVVGSLFIYSFLRRSIENNIENELTTSTTTLLNMVKTSASVSLKNYLRAVVEKNLEIAAYCHGLYLQGAITEAEAKQRAANILLSQKIGNSGYIYCIDSSGTVRVHPQKALIGVNISQYEFVREQKKRKSGYLEYDWKNPGEVKGRAKALHMSYFEPWDWIISVSLYREESSQLVNVDDFRDSILSLHFGQTGYSYVINLKGTFIIHPKLEGVNGIEETDAAGSKFIAKICSKRNGKIVYPWQNPGESSLRKKLVIFNYIPELDWIVASSSYLEEFYAPLKNIQGLMLVGLISSLVLFITITFFISTSITNPLRVLKEKFDIGATGDFSVRMRYNAMDEIGQLAIYFNTFMSKLETYSTDLKKEIEERQQVEKALRTSEEMFSKAFRSSPSAIFIADFKKLRFINVNDSLLNATGYAVTELVGRKLADSGLFPQNYDGDNITRILAREHHIRSITMEFQTRNGEIRTGHLSAERIELWGRSCILATIEDVTEALRLEKEIVEISENERLSIGQNLHDDLCPHLIGIEVLCKVLKNKLADQGIEAETNLAEKMRTLTMEAITKARIITRGLYPVNLDVNGFKSAIQELLENIRNLFLIDYVFECADGAVFQDNALATQLYYIIHEAVHNAVKHSEADKVILKIADIKGRYVITIQDHGRGIVDHRLGLGMRIMGLRAKKIGADLDINSNGGSGTCVTVTLRKRNSLS